MDFNFKRYYQDPLYLNSLSILINSISTAFFGFIFWIIATKLMPASEVGLATAIISIITLIITISNLGMDIGLIRYLPSLENKGRLFSTIISSTTIISIILSILFLMFIDILSPKLHLLKEGILPFVFICYIIIFSISNLQNLALTAIRKAHLSVIQNIFIIIRIPLIFLIASLGASGILTTFLITLILSIILGVILLRREHIIYKPELDMGYIKSIFNFSLGNYISGIFTAASISIISIIIINNIGIEYNAYYYIAYSISSMMLMIPFAVSTALLVEGSHNSDMQDNIIKSIKLITLLLLPILAVILLFGDKILLLFSMEYSTQTFEVLKFLAISNVFAAVISVYIAVKKVEKDVRTINIVSITVALLTIIFGYVFLKWYGLVGIGYATIVANALMCAIIIILITKSIINTNKLKVKV